MTRGRTPAVTRERILLEILLEPDRAVFPSEIAANVDVGAERVRQLCRDLSDDGLISVEQLPNGNIYRLTDAGLERLAPLLREAVD